VSKGNGLISSEPLDTEPRPNIKILQSVDRSFGRLQPGGCNALCKRHVQPHQLVPE